MKRVIIIISSIFLLLELSGNAYSGEVISESNAVINNLIETQNKFYELAIAFDIAVYLYNEYPAPDWLLRINDNTDTRDMKYKEIHDNYSESNPALIERITKMRLYYHFDALAAIPASEDLMSTSTHFALHQGLLFRDPFLGNCIFGYIGTKNDYMLISVGPDKKPDILNFKQYYNGDYVIHHQLYSRNQFDDIYKLGISHLSSDDPRDWYATIKTDVNKIYDPTNGIISSGDVVFRRRAGDNFMFSYISSILIKENNIVKKDLTEYNQKSK